MRCSEQTTRKDGTQNHEAPLQGRRQVQKGRTCHIINALRERVHERDEHHNPREDR